MTLPRLRALNAHWEREPPMSTLLAAYVGYQPPAKKTRVTRKKLRSLMAKMLGG